jgi:hypothetical protein
MLLKELIDLERAREIQKSADPWTFPERMAGKNHEEIGLGRTAVTFKSKKPNTVIKTSYHKSLDDPYITYLKTVQAHQDNPFFPRIYKAKIYKDEENLYALRVEMEKLISLYDPKMIDTAPHIFRQLGLSFGSHDRNDWNNPAYVKDVIESTNNPKFAEALRILSPYFQKFSSDLHKKNMMVRLTGSGPQLVITDPFMPSVVVYS